LDLIEECEDHKELLRQEHETFKGVINEEHLALLEYNKGELNAIL